jgi:F-type H+-transporting ATPase subunit beta
MSKNGKIVQVIGAVVDAAFPSDSVPAIFDAIQIEFEVGGSTKSLTLEVQQHLGQGLVRAVAMTSTDGLVRGMEVKGTGAPISVPVGEAVLGRIFNVTGDTVDEKGPVATDERRPIHRMPP